MDSEKELVPEEGSGREQQLWWDEEQEDQAECRPMSMLEGLEESEQPKS